jgi:pimeloyl-ACP methyl ester carboxylesterase
MEDLGGSFRMIAPDLRGAGGSPLPESSFACHEDVKHLLDHFGIERTWMVGNSFGARVAVDFCLVYPERIDGMLLVSPVLGGFEPGVEVREFNEEEDVLLEKGDLHEATEHNMRMWLAGPYREKSDMDPKLWSQLTQMQYEAFQVPEPEGVEFIGVDFSAADRLGEIAKPVLVLQGDRDVSSVVEHAASVAERIPGARLEILPGVGHMLSMEEPGKFNQIVRAFLLDSQAGKPV